LVQLPNDQLVAIEIKASSALNRHDARHLTMLGDSLGERQLAGVLLHRPARFLFEPTDSCIPYSSAWVLTPDNMSMSGHEYANRIAEYIQQNFAERRVGR
jgi:hypothetical protein